MVCFLYCRKIIREAQHIVSGAAVVKCFTESYHEDGSPLNACLRHIRESNVQERDL